MIAALMILPQSAVFADTEAVSDAKDASTFTISDSSRFYIVTEEEPAAEILATVQSESRKFAAAGIPSETPLAIVCGKEKHMESGDIVIRLDTQGAGSEQSAADVEAARMAQSYEIVTSDDGTVWVTGFTDRGLMYGLDELLKIMMLHDGSVSCNIHETPASSNRTLLLDCGRKYYSPEWIENLIRRMSDRKSVV